MSELFFVEFLDLETGEQNKGVMVNSAYCPVRGTWIMLVHSGDTGKFHTVSSEGVEVRGYWQPDEYVFIDGDEDEDEDSEDS